MSTDQTGKVRENRLRRAAERQGWRLVKSRRRDPRALSYGRYMLAGAHGSRLGIGEATGEPAFTLDEVEAVLTTREQDQETRSR